MTSSIDMTKVVEYANNSLKFLSHKMKIYTELLYSNDPEIALLRLNRVSNLLNIALMVMEKNLTEDEWQDLIISLSRTTSSDRLPKNT